MRTHLLTGMLHSMMVGQAELLHQEQAQTCSTSRSTVWESEPILRACFDGVFVLKPAVHWPWYLPRPCRGAAMVLRLVRPACAALACGDNETTTLAGVNSIYRPGVPVNSMLTSRHSTNVWCSMKMVTGARTVLHPHAIVWWSLSG